MWPVNYQSSWVFISKTKIVKYRKIHFLNNNLSPLGPYHIIISTSAQVPEVAV